MRDLLGAWLNFRKAPSTSLPLHPASCFGDNLGLLDPNNKYTGSCWEARAPFREQFRDHLLPELKEFLEAHPHTARTSDRITISLYMIGQSTESAEPTIIFISEDATARKAARKAINKSEILAAYPEFVTKSVSKDPGFRNLQTLASESSSSQNHMAVHAGKVYYNPSQEACSGSMVVYVQHGSTFRPTTAFLVEDDAHVALKTVYHAFLPSSISSATSSEDTLEQIEIDSDTDSETEDDDELNVDRTSAWSHSSYAESDSGSGSDLSRRSSLSSGWDTPSVHLGHASGTGTELPDLSAVIPRLEEYTSTSPSYPIKHLDVPNEDELAPLGILAASSLDKDWAIIKITNAKFATTMIAPSEVQETGRLQVVYQRSEQPKANASVIAYTSSGQKLCGTMSGTPSCMRLPTGDSFQEVYTVRLKGGLANGDCGSPIVDASTGVLYGHVVAGCRSTGTAYIMAAYHHEMEIQKALQECEPSGNRELQVASTLLQSLTPVQPTPWLRAVQYARMESPRWRTGQIPEVLRQDNIFWSAVDSAFGFAYGIVIERNLRCLPFELPAILPWQFVKALLVEATMHPIDYPKIFSNRAQHLVGILKIFVCIRAVFPGTVNLISNGLGPLNLLSPDRIPFHETRSLADALTSEWILPGLAFAYTLPKRSHQAYWNIIIIALAILTWSPDIISQVKGYIDSFTDSIGTRIQSQALLSARDGANTTSTCVSIAPLHLSLLHSASSAFIVVAAFVTLRKFWLILSLVSRSIFLRFKDYQHDGEAHGLKHGINAVHVFTVAFSAILGHGLYRIGLLNFQPSLGVRNVDFFQRVTGKLSGDDVRALLIGCFLGTLILVAALLIYRTLCRRKLSLLPVHTFATFLSVVGDPCNFCASSIFYLQAVLYSCKVPYMREALDIVIGAFNWFLLNPLKSIIPRNRSDPQKSAPARTDFKDYYQDRRIRDLSAESTSSLLYHSIFSSTDLHRGSYEGRDIVLSKYDYPSAFSISRSHDDLLSDQKSRTPYKHYDASFMRDQARHCNLFPTFAAFASIVWLVVLGYISSLPDSTNSKAPSSEAAPRHSMIWSPEHGLLHVAQLSVLISIIVAWKYIVHKQRPGARLRFEHAILDWNVWFHLPITVTWVATQLVTTLLKRYDWIAELIKTSLGLYLVAMVVWIGVGLTFIAARSATIRLLGQRSRRIKEIVVLGLLASLGATLLFLHRHSQIYEDLDDRDRKIQSVAWLYIGSLSLFTLSALNAFFMKPWTLKTTATDLLTIHLLLAAEIDMNRSNDKTSTDSIDNWLPRTWWGGQVLYKIVYSIKYAVAPKLRAVAVTWSRLRDFIRDIIFHWRLRLQAWRGSVVDHLGPDFNSTQRPDSRSDSTHATNHGCSGLRWSWKVVTIAVCLAAVIGMGINSFLLKEVENWKRPVILRFCQIPQYYIDDEPKVVPCLEDKSLPKVEATERSIGYAFAIKSYKSPQSCEAFRSELQAFNQMRDDLKRHQHLFTLASQGTKYLRVDQILEQLQSTIERLDILATAQHLALQRDIIDTLLKSSNHRPPDAALSALEQAFSTDSRQVLDPGPPHLCLSNSTQALSYLLNALTNLITFLQSEPHATTALRDAYTAFSNHFKQLDHAIDRALHSFETSPRAYSPLETRTCLERYSNDSAIEETWSSWRDHISAHLAPSRAEGAGVCGEGALIIFPSVSSPSCCPVAIYTTTVFKEQRRNWGRGGRAICPLELEPSDPHLLPDPERVWILARELKDFWRGRSDLESVSTDFPILSRVSEWGWVWYNC